MSLCGADIDHTYFMNWLFFFSVQYNLLPSNLQCRRISFHINDMVDTRFLLIYEP
jgi:hypothetical protein